MASPPTFDAKAIKLLAERTEYEMWLLEAVYEIVEQNLFHRFPAQVIYPVNRSRPEFNQYSGVRFDITDWRPDFLNAGAPLVFITTFKLLDMFIEWILEVNGYQSTFRFMEKIKNLDRLPIFPELIESRPWLKERLIGLYRTLEPLRGTIIHDKHFTSSNGNIRISSSKGNVIGPQIEIGSSELRKFALSVVSICRYIDGTWCLDQYREKVLRHYMDSLLSLHEFPSLNQLKPYYQIVSVFSTDLDPQNVNPTAISIDLAKQYPGRDCMFDMRVLTVKGGAVLNAFLFPWAIFENKGSEWGGNINPNDYLIPIPNDIKPQHYEVDRY